MSLADVARTDVVRPVWPLFDRFKIAFAAPELRPGRPRLRPVSPERPAASGEAPEPARPSPYPAFRSTPPSRPLAMPKQDLRAAPRAGALPDTEIPLRRLVLTLGPALMAGLVGFVLVHVLGRDGVTVAEGLVVLLSVLLSGWVGFGFVSASAGFVAILASRGASPPAKAATGEAAGRIAVLLPTYNEDPGLILAAVEAIAHDLQRIGAAERYDLFILSDTREEEIARAEAVGLLRLRSRMPAAPGLYYRRRARNLDRKAGNIGEWVETHGGGYAYMLVLDADSLMTGETIAALAAGMDADPRLGLLQTVPTIVNAQTPFARLQQFASRLYGPVFARGQEWWSGSEGNYWGHNAMIRVAAFAESAGLPHLKGKKPFGGHILSHDFIEAALLRRRGWAVRTISSLPGSYEETPPTLLDTAARDRRWCQGNLQHARLLWTRGLHWISRLHLLSGIFAYVAPALWLALLVCGAVVWPQQHLRPTSELYTEVVALFALSLALLAAPKAMALTLALASPSTRRGFGGTGRLIAGFLVETLVSMLTTPVMMVMQSVAVIEVLIGRDSGWSAQRREGVELSRGDAWRAHGGHVLLGVFGGLGAYLVSKDFLMWTSPVFLSLTLSALLSLHTSRPRSGRDRPGLFQIPEDGSPPPVLERSRALRQAYAEEAATRRRIEQLFKEPAPVYEVIACPVQPSRLRLVA